MNQRLSDSEAAPAVYKAMLALQASVDKFGLKKDLMDLVCLRISHRKRTKVHRENSLSSTVAFSHMTTGDAHWAKDTKVWFVLIKDSKGRYPNNPLRGDGWGWALFKSDAPNKQVATDYKKDCLGCHIPAKADDWIYVKGYPVLHSK